MKAKRVVTCANRIFVGNKNQVVSHLSGKQKCFQEVER